MQIFNKISKFQSSINLYSQVKESTLSLNTNIDQLDKFHCSTYHNLITVAGTVEMMLLFLNIGTHSQSEMNFNARVN